MDNNSLFRELVRKAFHLSSVFIFGGVHFIAELHDSSYRYFGYHWPTSASSRNRIYQAGASS